MRDAYGMIGIFQDDNVGCLLQRRDMVAQIGQIDAVPDGFCKLEKFRFRHVKKVCIKRTRVSLCRAPEAMEAFRIPSQQVVFLCIEIHKIVRLPRRTRRRRQWLEAKAFEDQYIGLCNGSRHARVDVVGDMAIAGKVGCAG